MKLTLIGGGGVRSPLFVMTLLRWQKRIGVTELCLMDIDERKLALFSGLCRQLVRRAGDSFSLTTTTDARVALSGADHVVTTIRAGFEQGRATDERIALRHGVLGQETTGPGRFCHGTAQHPGHPELCQTAARGQPAGLDVQLYQSGRAGHAGTARGRL